MLARILETRVQRFGLVLLLLAPVPIAWTALHHYLDRGFVTETRRFELRPAPKPVAGKNDVVLRSGPHGWAILNRDCYEAKLAAWRKENAAKPMPLPRDCATGYRQHKTVATTASEFKISPWLKRLVSTRDGYFFWFTIAAFSLLTGLIMVSGLFDRIGRWIFWGE